MVQDEGHTKEFNFTLILFKFNFKFVLIELSIQPLFRLI